MELWEFPKRTLGKFLSELWEFPNRLWGVLQPTLGVPSQLWEFPADFGSSQLTLGVPVDFEGVIVYLGVYSNNLGDY